MTIKLTTTTLTFLAMLHMASAQYKGWQHSGSMYILTTPEGANLKYSPVNGTSSTVFRLMSDL